MSWASVAGRGVVNARNRLVVAKICRDLPIVT